MKDRSAASVRGDAGRGPAPDGVRKGRDGQAEGSGEGEVGDVQAVSRQPAHVPADAGALRETRSAVKRTLPLAAGNAGRSTPKKDCSLDTLDPICSNGRMTAGRTGAAAFGFGTLRVGIG